MLGVRTFKEKFGNTEAIVELVFGKPDGGNSDENSSVPVHVLGPVTIWACVAGTQPLLGVTHIFGKNSITGEIFSSALAPEDVEDSSDDDIIRYNKMLGTRLLKAVPEYHQMFVSCTNLAKADRKDAKLIEKRIIDELITFRDLKTK